MIFSKQIEKIYSKTLFSRHDEDGTIFYFSHKDFEGLHCEPYQFKNQKDEILRGAFYSYEGYKKDRLIVFDHGMGAGHKAYMKEIEMLARGGYKVFSYDHTGCTMSEGKCIRGFAGSLSDLDACISALRKEKEYMNIDISVVGHSWGAFSTMNIPALHPDIRSIVAISGFVSVREMQKQVISGPLALWRKTVFALEERENPEYVNFSADESLKGKKTLALIIHSDDDRTVSHKRHHLSLKEALAGEKNVEFLSVSGKDHNPNYTAEAIAEKARFFADLTAKKKAGALESDEQKSAFLSSYDWHKITEQDEKIWQKILSHLEK